MNSLLDLMAPECACFNVSSDVVDAHYELKAVRKNLPSDDVHGLWEGHGTGAAVPPWATPMR